MWRLVNRFSLLGLLGLILLPVLVLGHVRFYSSRSRLPERGNETVTVAGLREPVEVFIDGMGMPTIEGGSAEDLWFAQGYIHSRDRFFQMDLARRAANRSSGGDLWRGGARQRPKDEDSSDCRDGSAAGGISRRR